MSKFLSQLLLPLAIFVLGTTLRFSALSAYAPFDWDQNRDYHEVAKIVSGKLTLIGPVARGEGGFFLGPLYYYLLVPAFLSMQGSLLALPLTSVILDLAALVMIFVLGFTLKNRRFAYIFALLWAVSPAAIASARVSWNVALLPLWFLALMTWLNRASSSPRSLVFLGVLAGLSWHIHAALIPLAPILLLTRIRTLTESRWSNALLLLFGYLLPLSPLILFDLRHSGLQSSLMTEMFSSQLASRASWLELLVSSLARFGKNLSSFFGGPGDLNLGLGIAGTLYLCYNLVWGILPARLAATSALANLVLVILLGVVAFPEYYLATATLSFCLCLALMLSSSQLYLGLVGVFLGYLYFLPPAPPSPYSLAHKQALVSRVAAESKQATIIYDLPFGRESGIPLLLTRAGVTAGDVSSTIYLISEKTDQTLYITGEIATDVGYFGAYRLVKRDVQ